MMCLLFDSGEPDDKRAKNGAGDAQSDYNAYWAQYQVYTSFYLKLNCESVKV